MDSSLTVRARKQWLSGKEGVAVALWRGKSETEGTDLKTNCWRKPGAMQVASAAEHGRLCLADRHVDVVGIDHSA